MFSTKFMFHFAYKSFFYIFFIFKTSQSPVKFDSLDQQFAQR